RNALCVNKIKHQKENRCPQEIDEAALNKTEAAEVADLFEFQLEDFVRGRIKAVNLLLSKTQTLHSFDVPQGFSRRARYGRRLRHDTLLDGLDSAAQQRTKAAKQRNCQQISWGNGPVYLGG